MTQKKRIATAATAIVLSASLVLGGTMAWQSINQEALNEKADVVNPGGRLHDDFDGANKDVYVENFSDPDDGGQDIYVRIRLDECLELYGLGGTTYFENTHKDDKNTWRTYKPEADSAVVLNIEDPFREIVDWTMEGETVYLPTFNMNKDSLEADVNGTLLGPDGTDNYGSPVGEDRYEDYTEYTLGQTVSATAIRDADTNAADEVGEAGLSVVKMVRENNYSGLNDLVTAGNVKINSETHTAAETPFAAVMTMQAWIDAGMPTGDIWVYDYDGWAYYARAIAPGEASGLLLDKIRVDVDDTYYYAINVVSQFVTANDLGQDDGTGFYDTTKGVIPSAEALVLLAQIGAVDFDFQLTADAATIVKGETMTITAKNYVNDVTFAIMSDVAEGTTIEESADQNGVATLTVSADETATQITVQATDSATGDTANYTVFVKEAAANP